MGQVIFSKTSAISGYSTSTRYVRITTTDTFDPATGKYTVALSKVEFQDSKYGLGSVPFYGRVYINETLVYNWTGSTGNVSTAAGTYKTVGHTNSYGSVQVDNGGTVTIRIASATTSYTTSGMGAAYQSKLFTVGTGSKSYDLEYVSTGSVHIYHGSEFQTYDIKIYSNGDWEKYVPYIYHNGSWEAYT